MNGSVVLQLDCGPGNARNSEGAFVTLRDGRLLFAWSQYVTDNNDDAGCSRLVCRTSSDGGRRWSAEDRLLIDPADAVNVMSVSLLRLHDGRIAFLYLRKEAAAHNTLHCMPLIRFSTDEMESLSKPVSLSAANGYHVVNNDRLIQLKNGRLLVPVGEHRFRGASRLVSAGISGAGFADPALIYYLFSDDGGATWFESQGSYYRCFPNGGGLQEPGVIELDGGRLWSWTRTGWTNSESVPHQWQSFSADGGQTWSEPQPSVFASPCSPLSMKRIPQTGHLFAVWNDYSGRFPVAPALPTSWYRTPLVCAISRDEGETWESHQLLEDAPDHGYCYTAIHFTDDAVLLAYCAGGASSKIPLDTLRVRRIELEALYN